MGGNECPLIGSRAAITLPGTGALSMPHNAALQPRRPMIAQAAVGCKRLLGSWSGWYIALVTFTIELEQEADGRWLAEVPAIPGVMCYGADRDEAVARVQALALRVIAERLEHREAPAELVNVTLQAA
jgi:predicted RNase H-like HicB family nuclease